MPGLVNVNECQMKKRWRYFFVTSLIRNLLKDFSNLILMACDDINVWGIPQNSNEEPVFCRPRLRTFRPAA